MTLGRTGMFAGAAIAGILTVPSCNAVKEARQECPCILSVELKGLPAYPVTLLLNGGVAGEARRDTTLQLWVEKGGWASLEAISGTSDTLVSIPYGTQSPAVYAWRARVDCRGEYARAAVRLHKHFCTLSVRFSGPPGWDAPPSVAVRGSVGGLSLPEGRPLEGAFACTLEDGSCRIPRHRPGDALWLDIVMADSVLRSFPLGACLEQAGYDWMAPDLPDKALEVDVSVSAVGFRTGDWSTVENRPIVL